MSRKDLSRMRAPSIPAQPYDPSRRQNPSRGVSDDVCFLEDLEIGDAGAGYRMLKKNVIFSRLFDNVSNSTLNPFTKVYQVAQDPPPGGTYDNCRIKMFSVHFWGTSLIRLGDNGDDFFFPDREGNALSAGPDGPLTQVPTPLKGYIKTDDGIWQIFDILGARTFQVYGTHIDAGFLAPDASYDASSLPLDGSSDTSFDGLVDQSDVGVSISRVVVNSTQVEDDYTRVVRIPLGVTVLVPVTGGARSVCVSTDSTFPVSMDFTWNPLLVAWKGLSDIPVSAEIVVSEQTPRMCIPGAPFIRLSILGAAGPRTVALTFAKEL